MSETRSASQKQANTKESGLQMTRTSRVRTAKIRRTREVIERVEVEHAAEAGELPVVTTAEQRVVKATEMERGKLLSDDPLPQEQVTSSSHTARKQPGRASKRSSQNETDIPIEGDVGPSVHVSEVAQDEAGQMGPAFMSTQDYLEEAEDLLNHPLEPNPLDTQPEDGAQQEEPDAGNPTEQAPEEAAATGERLAEHIQPAPQTETAGDNGRQGTGSAAHANEGGLVGRVAQVGRQIVRSLLHPNEHGHEEAPAAAAGAEDAGDQGEPATGATQEYHVEEPDQSASEAEEPQEQPSKGRGRSKKAETTPAQAAMKNTPKEVQPVEEVLAADEEAEPEEEAAPAPATPPAKRGRPAAPKTPPNTKGKGKAAAEQVQEVAGAPEAEESPVGKKARSHPSKAASASQPSKRSNPAKRSRVETAELQEEGDRSKKSQKTEANPAGSPESQAAPKTPARAARKPASAEPSPKTPSKAPAKASGAKTSPKKTASRAPAKTAGARAKGPQKKPARQAASRRKERTESFKIYIHRVLKEIHPDISLSQRAISVLDSFTKDMHDRIANEAGDLCRRHNKSTLSSREIDAAIRFLLPGELFNHAVAEGRKAVTRALTKSD